MEFLLIPSVGFIVLLMATGFIVGEMLVKTKGLFGVIGLGLITTFFIFHVSGDNLLWISILYVVGIVLVFVDGKFINDGSVAILGIILMVVSVVIPAPSIIYGVLSALGLVIGALLAPLLLKVFPSRDMWSKMALKDRLTSEEGYNSLNSSYVKLLGKRGQTITQFRPVGTIEIDGKKISAISEGSWLESGVEIEVYKVDGTKIVIKKVEG
jgi:membrane-bound ClpP family serine protease